MASSRCTAVTHAHAQTVLLPDAVKGLLLSLRTPFKPGRFCGWPRHMTSCHHVTDVRVPHACASQGLSRTASAAPLLTGSMRLCVHTASTLDTASTLASPYLCCAIGVRRLVGFTAVVLRASTSMAISMLPISLTPIAASQPDIVRARQKVRPTPSKRCSLDGTSSLLRC